MLNLSLPSLNEQAVFNESSTIQAKYKSIRAPKQSVKKRLFDIVVASLVIVSVLIWFIPLVGLLIRLTSPGPVLFVQLRTGRNGRPFRCLKFRTMTYERNAEFRQATRNDNRVTKIGQILRKTNLDELPQVFNVLLGNMSIVGPRPHPIQLDAQHWHTLPHYPTRYTVKPGITGLAQVRGHRGETAERIQMEHRIRLDRLYIYKRSIALDIQICLWTVTSMIKGDRKAW
ncbi:sugar transferase [Spirosoma utsteinense]|uniref:Colanic acid biosynthesis UDP-glucose lipid carrier transferase n=1 Tax=Spirosoma utsteinense TaxID=2585773 RepID=A0ABR6W8Y6_9BACT|nr:sugar transferase [Spirosoma utsteinense]MBC3787405.1 putative colanic acid biosynthesis UDP-glucose lipid carrier transferase [Spirosoma utsteinense]MBC3793040.1 putative colanic acid biosynthesis UDP-glucose lipid carrier transferase [Spirosoma utsteinense]